MKLACIILACMAAAAVQSSPVNQDVKVADKPFLEKQKFFLEILRNIGDLQLADDLIKHGDKLVFEEGHYTVIDDQMRQFYESYKKGDLLDQGDFFSTVNKEHLQQALGLFNFFYNAKDWDTLEDNMVWARLNVNQGMFVYALTLAVIHRPDLNGIILPAIHEILPQLFFNSKLIMQAEQFDLDVLNRQIMYENRNVNAIHNKQQRLTKDFKTWQWWKLMGLDEKFHLGTKSVLRENSDILKNDSKWTALWNDMKMIWMPVDYTRDIEIINEDTQLSYLTEDLGWNSFFYYLNMDYASMLSGEKYNLNKDRRGEWWMYIIQQIVARYEMERLSHGMGDISELPWHGVVKSGYDPKMIAYNGIPFTVRKNYWEVQSHQNVELLNRIMNVDRRIDDVIAMGEIVTKDGVTIDLSKSESIEIIGSLMQGNVDIPDLNFFGYYMKLANAYLSGSDYHDMTVMPSVFQNYETMLRDPLFYQLLKKQLDVVKNHKKILPVRKPKQLLLKGVNIIDVKVDKLMTYFDLVDSDVSNLLKENIISAEGKIVWDKTLLARQMRLNHRPYNVEITVNSDIAQKVVVRKFLGPAIDENGQKINLMKHSDKLIHLDSFVYDLVAGENVIKRSSKDYTWTVQDRTTYSELYKLVMMAIDGKTELRLDISEPHCGFPSRLLLPRGWAKGMPMKIFVVITPYTEEQRPAVAYYDHSYSCGIASGGRHIDNLPFGFPFDRELDDVMVPNMFAKDVKIYHVDKFEKYNEHKYERFGTFDYHFN